MDYEQMPRAALIRLLQEQDAANRDAGKNGIVMSYTGRTAPWHITRQVKPKLSKIVKKHSCGDEAQQCLNEIWDGENLSTMVTLYKYRGQVDLIVADPPYNTGEDFRYNDKWDKDPNDPDLGELVPNTAHFFLRVDKESVFTDTIAKVREKLKAEGAPIEVVETYGGKGSGSIELLPRDGVDAPLCHVNVDASMACEKIAEIVDEFPAFSEGDANTVAQAHAATKILDLKKLEGDAGDPQWIAKGNTNPVRLRWLASLALKARSNRAYAVTDLKDHKFDVRVQVQSKANKLAESTATRIVETYFQHAELVYEPMHPFVFGPIRVPKAAPEFEHSLYERYAGFNKLELACA